MIKRRTLLIAALGGATSFALPRFARASAFPVFPGADTVRHFSVLYKSKRIGAHSIWHYPATQEIRVTTAIDMRVNALFFTVFSFKHRSEENWREGRLLSLKSETVEHGKTLQVTGVATDQGFRVAGKGDFFIAARDALTSNDLWTPAVLQQETVIDAQHGGIIGISVRKLDDEEIEVAGRQVRATRYRFITPYLAGSIWYDEADLWVHGEFERDAAQIVYRLDA